MEFTIELEKWGNHKNRKFNPKTRNCEISSSLFESGLMCCLGFITKQAGVPEEAMLMTGMPSSLSEAVLNDTPQWFKDSFLEKEIGNSALSAVAATINDDPEITDGERIMRLKAVFGSHDHQLVFTRGGIVQYPNFNTAKAWQAVVDGSTPKADPRTLKRERDRRYRAKLKAKRLEATVKAAEDAGLFPRDGDF